MQVVTQRLTNLFAITELQEASIDNSSQQSDAQT